MKAIVYSAYGSADVLRCEEVARPSVGDDDVLIKVRAASVNPLDWHFLRGEPYLVRLSAGLFRPTTTRLGTDVAGEVEAVGRNVTEFKCGEAVFGAGRGTFAEFACASPSALAKKPDTVTFEQAASVYVAALTALQGVRSKGPIQPGHHVLINGAAGGVGTFAVQIAKSCGATVAGVCSGRNVDLVRSIGADHVIDYTREDFTTSALRYDLMLDCVGNRSLAACRRLLTPNGAYVAVGGPSGRWMIAFAGRALRAAVLSRFVSQTLVLLMVKRNQEDVNLLGRLLASGSVTPVIDRCYSLTEVADAIRYQEQGHARGKVVIRVRPS